MMMASRQLTSLAAAIVAAAILAGVAVAAPKPASGGNWAGATAISPIGQPDPTRGSQLNDVAVNASGLTLAAWDQFTYNNGGSYSVGAAVQSAGKWSAPFTISGTTGFSMTPRVAVGADGTMAVSWTCQDPAGGPAPQLSKVQVAVKPASSSKWTTYTLASFTMGGVSITRSVPIAIDASGNLTAVWNEWNGARNVVKSACLPRDGTTWWAASTLSGNDDGLYLSLAVNARGDAAVAYTLSPYSSYPAGTWAEYVYRSGPGGSWTAPVQVSESISPSVGYITGPLVGLDASGLGTVIYMGYGVEAVRQLMNGTWTSPQTIIAAPNRVSSFQGVDLGYDDSGNAVVATSIFDATINVDRASIWVTCGDAAGVFDPPVRLTDPAVPVDAYAPRATISPDGSLALVGWIDHYHGTVRVSKLSGSVWGAADTVGKGTAFSSFQEVMGLRAGSGTVARAIWKSTKAGTQTMASNYR